MSVGGMFADDPEDFLDQFIAGCVNYINTMPMDVLRSISCLLSMKDLSAFARTCKRMYSAANSEEVWRARVLQKFWSISNGKPPAAWKLYFQHWWEVQRFWERAPLDSMSFTYHEMNWAFFNPDLSGFMVNETSNDVRTTRYVNLRKAKSYILRETNDDPLAPAPLVTPPPHHWSKHIFAVVEDAAVQLLDVGDGSGILPPPPLNLLPGQDRILAIPTALLWVGGVLVIGYHGGAVRGFNIVPSGALHPVVPIVGGQVSKSIRQLLLLEPGRFAALTDEGLHIWSAVEQGFNCVQVIHVSPVPITTFVPSASGHFVSLAGSTVHTWDLNPTLHTLDTFDLAKEFGNDVTVRALAADDDSAVIGMNNSLVVLRLRPNIVITRQIHLPPPKNNVRYLSLDGPLAAAVVMQRDIVHWADVRVYNIYTGELVRSFATAGSWLQLTGKELAVVSRGAVQLFKHGHVLPNKRMKVKGKVKNTLVF